MTSTLQAREDKILLITDESDNKYVVTADLTSDNKLKGIQFKHLNGSWMKYLTLNDVKRKADISLNKKATVMNVYGDLNEKGGKITFKGAKKYLQIIPFRLPKRVYAKIKLILKPTWRGGDNWGVHKKHDMDGNYVILVDKMKIRYKGRSVFNSTGFVGSFLVRFDGDLSGVRL